MDIKTRGIVISSVKFAESSLIVRIFTERLGQVSYIVNGVRTARSSARAAMLRPLTLLDLDILHRENKNLQRIKDFRRAHAYALLPFDTFRAASATLIIEVVSKSLRDHDPQPELFEYVYHSLVHLDEMIQMNNDFHLQFLVRYTHYLGFAPQGECEGDTLRFDLAEGSYVDAHHSGKYMLDLTLSKLLYHIDHSQIEQPLAIRITRGQRQALLQALLTYFQLHLEGFAGLNSPDVLRAVFDSA
jgi:DNA repair protein RecO (recombination protein O)